MQEIDGSNGKERKNQFIPPSPDKIIQLGLDKKSSEIVTVGLNLEPDRNDYFFGEISVSSLRKSIIKDLKPFGSMFEVAERQAVKQLKEDAQGDDLYPYFQQGILEVMDVLFDIENSRLPLNAHSLFILAAAKEKAKDRLHGYPADVINGVMLSNPQLVQPNHRGLFINAQRVLEQTIQRLTLIQEPAEKIKKTHIGNHNIESAMQKLNEFDAALAEKILSSNPEILSEINDALVINGQQTFRTFDIHEFKLQKLEKEIVYATEISSGIPVMFDSFRLTTDTFYHDDDAQDSLACLVQQQLAEHSFYDSNTHKNTLPFLHVELFKKISLLKKHLRTIQKGRQIGQTLAEVLKLYSLLHLSEEEFIDSNMKPEIEEEGTLYPFSPFELYTEALDIPKKTRQNSPSMIKGILNNSGNWNNPDQIELYEYLLKKGFKLPIPARLKDIKPPALKNEKGIKKLKNTSREELDASSKTPTVYLEGDPEELNKISEVIFPVDAELVYGFGQRRKKKLDPSKKVTLKNALPLLSDNSGVLQVPFPADAELDKIKVTLRESSSGFPISHYKLSHDPNGGLEFNVGGANDEYDIDIQFHLEDIYPSEVPAELQDMDTNVLLQIGKELNDKMGFKKLLSTLQEHIQRLERSGKSFSLYDLEAVLKEMAVYSYNGKTLELPSQEKPEFDYSEDNEENKSEKLYQSELGKKLIEALRSINAEDHSDTPDHEYNFDEQDEPIDDQQKNSTKNDPNQRINSILENFQLLSCLLNEDGSLEVQCDGAAIFAKNFVDYYFLKKGFKNMQTRIQFLLSEGLPGQNPGEKIFSLVGHTRIAIYKKYYRRIVAFIDSTPSKPDVPASEKLSESDTKPTISEISVDQGKNYLEQYATVSPKTEVELLLENDQYMKWVRSLSDFSYSYFKDLPFLAIPLLFEKIKSFSTLNTNQKRALKKEIEDQGNLLLEYQKQLVGSVPGHKLPTIKNVSTNPYILGTLFQLLHTIKRSVKAK